MLSDPVIVLLIAGCVFLFIAVIGGGISIRDVTVPTVPMPGRIISGIVGSAFLVIALILLTATDRQGDDSSDGAQSQASEAEREPDAAVDDGPGGPVAAPPMPAPDDAAGSGDEQPEVPARSTVTVVEGRSADFDDRLSLEVTAGSLSPLGMHHADIALIDREDEVAAVRQRAIAGNDYHILDYTVVVLDILEADEQNPGDANATVVVRFGVRQ